MAAPPDVRGFYAALSVDLPAYGGPDVSVRCFADVCAHSNDDQRPSCSVNLETGVWKCHGCGAAGNAYQAAIATGCTPVEADRLLANFGLPRVWGEVEAIYDYVDERGELLYQVVRSQGKQFRQRRPDPQTGEWLWNLKNTPRVLYRLPELAEAVQAGKTIYIVEGEKDVDAIRAVGAVATCNSAGAGKWLPGFAELFAGCEVVIVADTDPAGLRHANQVLESLHPVAMSARIMVAKEGKDASDHLQAGFHLDELELPPAVTDDLAVDDPPAADCATDGLPGEERSPGRGRDSRADELVRLAKESEIELFHDPDLYAYASFERDGHRETLRLRSGAFDRYLRHLYFQLTGKSPTSQALSDALATLEGEALFSGETLPVYLRLAGGDGVIYLELGDPDWTVVEITAEGWRLTQDPPVRFRRTRGMAALPIPTRGGSLKQLRELINVGSDDDWRLLVGWLLASLRPPGHPYPVLALHGEQGSAKSTTARILRDLIDPSTAPLRAAPRSERDLVILANNSWLVAFDNLSYLDPWLSDALCRLSTGGGFSTRELYSNDEERIFDAQRPLLLNGIEELATRSDLLDRSLLITLPTIPPDRRRNEQELWQAFTEAKPQILGALLDAVAAALANLPTTRLDEKPRMADFALWVTAAESALGWTPGAFITTYAQNRAEADALAIEASPIGSILLQLANNGFHGTASELLGKINDHCIERSLSFRSMPKTPNGVGAIVKRLAPNLRALGYTVEFERTSRQRTITLRRAKTTSTPATISVTPVTAPAANDADDAHDAPPAEHEAETTAADLPF
jgi:hypothetical protein